PTFVIAIDTVTLDPRKVTALDLDGVCTCDSRPGAFDDGGPRCQTATVTCDEDGGADNSLGAVAEVTASKVGIETVANRLIANGHRTVLLQIQKYNGLANDDEVRVGTMLAEGIHSQSCPSSVLDPATKRWSAGRCGDDAWAVNPASLVGSVPLVVGTGYVRDHRLVVARLNNAVPLPFNDESTLNFRLPVLTGQLVPLGEDLMPRDPTRAPTEKEKRLFRLDNGSLAGRVLAAEGVAAIGTYLQSNGTRLCTSPGFGLIHDSVCASADIQGKPLVPDDPTRGCDALSAALGFTAIPAVTSFVSDAGPPPTGCESVDAAAFACP
ncbi:MAG TPA: hypothetical protein VLT33_16545, partial [Labilithrix sp.]|nr:hypothetical protein [Labilithrix sp.]